MSESKGVEFTVAAADAARSIGINVRTLQNWVKQKKVSAKRVGGGENRRYFFREEDVKRLSAGEVVNPELIGA